MGANEDHGNKIAKSLIASTIQKMILRPTVTYEQAEGLAAQIIYDLYKLDRFVVHIPADGKSHGFSNPKD